MPGPARGYKWKDATAGNFLNLRHGARSPRKVDPMAAELIAGVLQDRPDLARFPEATWAWARAEARCILFADYLLEYEPWSEEGQKVSAWVHRVESQAQHMRERLGLDPKAEAELLREQADATHATFDVEALRARGREAIARTYDRGGGGEAA
jgi:hypothetical protein